MCLSDIDMITGFEFENLIKVGFLNDEIKQNLRHYKKHFDIVILNDSDMNYVYKMLMELIKK